MSGQNPACTARLITGFAALMSMPLLMLLSAGNVHAHGSERGLVMLLPTGYTKLGSGLAVAASFIVLAVIPARWMARVMGARVPLFAVPQIPRSTISLASFAALLVLVLIGRFGTHDPLENLLPLVVWTLFWIIMPIAAASIGNFWPWLNPWTGPLVLMRKMLGRNLGRIGILKLPEKLGQWPAALPFGAFAWFELVSSAPDNPPGLAVAVGFYWLFTLAAMLLFGEAEWKRRGEPFSMFFHLVGMISLLIVNSGKGRRRLILTVPGFRMLSAPPLSLSGITFIALTLASVSFDGFSKTFTWLGRIGVNPLEFEGRSQVTIVNTVGLLGSFLLIIILYQLTILAGYRLAGSRSWVTNQALAGKLIYSLIPISIAFHGAHYLGAFLVNGQYLASAISDPFSTGNDLFGTARFHVTTSFLANLDDVSRIWTAQTTIIVAGHIAGIVIAHMIAIHHFSDNRAAILSQIPLATLMVFYTVFGLWLLSTPSIG